MEVLTGEHGKSLTEILVVLAVIGLMASLAGPSFVAMTVRNEARNATAEIASELRLAGLRELAMQEGMMTLVQDGIQKTLQGLTTYRQVRAVAIK